MSRLRHGCSQSETGQQCVEPKMVGQGLTELSRFRRRVSVEDHVEHPGHYQQAEKIGLIRKVAQHGKDEYVYKALSKLSVVKGAHAGDKAEHGSESGTRGAGWSNVNRRWSVCRSGRNSTFQASRKAVLAINH